MNRVELLLIQVPILVFALVAGEARLAAQSAKSDPATGVIRGRIKEQKGRSLEGVSITATLAGAAGRHEAVSGGQGDFVLKDLAPGDYVLTFAKPGYKTFTTRPLAVAAGETIRLRSQIELTREDDPYAVIRGAILQGVGYSLPDATVILERVDGKKKMKMETVSREGGEFAFRFKADQARYRLTARAAGFDDHSIEIAIENDEVRNVALTLKPRQ